MSMELNVVKFKHKNGRLDADYSAGREGVLVTEFLNGLISEEFISEFSAFEEGEEIIYREILEDDIPKLSEKTDEKMNSLLFSFEEALGKSKKEELWNNIKDIILLDQLLKRFLIECNSSDSSDDTIKFLIH